jgi:sugar lactone lactonase YvrE
MYWTSIRTGVVHVKRPGQPVKVLAQVPACNSINFSPDGTRLYVSQVFGPDGLWEIDPNGVKPSRKIAENIGGLNAFQVGPDGMIYGPLQFKGQYVKIDPDSGRVTVVNGAFQRPGASKLDGKGFAYVSDAGTREIWKVEIATGARTKVASLPTTNDNLALDSKGRLFVTLPAWNSIQEVNLSTGSLREVVKPAVLAAPAGVAVTQKDGADVIYVGDIFSVPIVDAKGARTGLIDISMNQPTRVSVSGGHLVVASEREGEAQVFDLATGKKLSRFAGADQLSDALEAPGGGIIVTERTAGNITLLTSEQAADKKVLASGLGGPAGLAWAGPGAVYVTERSGGRLTRVSLADGSKRVLASGLDTPEGVAVTADGKVLVVEVGKKRLVAIDPKSGAVTTAAEALPIGLVRDGLSLFRAVTVSPSAVYISSDTQNAIYKLTAR